MTRPADDAGRQYRCVTVLCTLVPGFISTPLIGTVPSWTWTLRWTGAPFVNIPWHDVGWDVSFMCTCHHVGRTWTLRQHKLRGDRSTSRTFSVHDTWCWQDTSVWPELLLCSLSHFYKYTSQVHCGNSHIWEHFRVKTLLSPLTECDDITLIHL